MAGSQITITGWLAKTPETRYTSNGQAVTTLAITEKESWQ